MKRYTMQDLNHDGKPAKEDTGLSLQRVGEMTDWTEEEFDRISSMAVGSFENFNGITVERTA